MIIKKFLFKFLIILLSPFLIFFILPESEAKAVDTIKVSGFSSPRNPAPLVGFSPNYYFENDPNEHLRQSLLDVNKFGPNGTVSCPIEFKPFVDQIVPGSLVQAGKRTADVFFAGLTDSELTNNEAWELANFIRAGGVVYISSGGYSDSLRSGYQGYDGWYYNKLFEVLGIADGFPEGEVIDFYLCGTTSNPIETNITNGPFGRVGPLDHFVFNPINTSSLKSVATGFDELCFIGLSLGSEGAFTLSENSGNNNRTILAEGRFGQGYLSVSGEPLYLYTDYSPEKEKYFLNLFSLACKESGDSPPAPFLDLPWDYKGKGLTFSQAALAIGSYFDHEYPFSDVGSVLREPEEAKNSVTNYEGRFRDLTISYSGHDGYDWLKKAKVFEGDPVLAAASGIATFYPAGKNNAACGSSACGNVIVIDHQNGYQTRYYHLQDNDPVSQSFATSRFVNQGEMIGRVGSTGKSSAPHIHFSVIQDKDGDGDFDDNRPDGMTDPFGWQSQEVDPWPDYSFEYKGVQRTGNKSYYLWTKPIPNLSEKLTSNAGYFRLENFQVDFPQGFSEEPLTVSMNYSPIVRISDFLESIGPVLLLKLIDSTGNPITSFFQNFILSVDFSNFDISKYLLSSISIYSSEDGINWQKEETSVDFGNKLATASLNHTSYFILAGEKIDTIPPQTQIILEGDEGEENWFRSDVKITLDPQDNEDGLGVYYTGVNIDDTYFKEYTEPFIISSEGEHKVEFYSVDNAENIEEIKTITFHIDKTPPEAKIEFSPNQKDVVVVGIDENETEVNFEDKVDASKLDKIIIKDKSGNTLELEGRFRKFEKLDTYSIETIRYNDGEVFAFDRNFYFAGFSLDRKSGEFNEVIQSWYDKGETLLSIIYNAKNDESRIYKKDKGEKIQKEAKQGLVLLYVRTNNANLEFGYE